MMGWLELEAKNGEGLEKCLVNTDRVRYLVRTEGGCQVVFSDQSYFEAVGENLYESLKQTLHIVQRRSTGL